MRFAKKTLQHDLSAVCRQICLRIIYVPFAPDSNREKRTREIKEFVDFAPQGLVRRAAREAERAVHLCQGVVAVLRCWSCRPRGGLSVERGQEEDSGLGIRLTPRLSARRTTRLGDWRIRERVKHQSLTIDTQCVHCTSLWEYQLQVVAGLAWT